MAQQAPESYANFPEFFVKLEISLINDLYHIGYM